MMSGLRLLPFRCPGSRRDRATLLALATIFSALGSCVPNVTFPDDDGGTTGGQTSSDGGSPSSGGTGGTGGTGGGMAGSEPGTGGGGGELVVDPCENERLDPNETDIDCGGTSCDPCPLRANCEQDRDCENNSCLMETCLAPGCKDGYLNPALGETDVDCGGTECGLLCADGETCAIASDCESGVCSSRECVPRSCTDTVRNGTEADVDCGGAQQENGETCQRCSIGSTCVQDSDCVVPDEEFGAVSKCEADPEGVERCVLKCPPNKGDCNQSANDGCEIDLNTTTDHCSACNTACRPDNAEGQCVAGNCQLIPDSCVPGFQNCNGSPTDGCETDISLDAEYCGSCDVSCSDNHGTPSCSGGKCRISCAPGYDDCNDDPSDGCEANLNSSILHCGECGNSCSAGAGNSPLCDQGMCDEIACAGGSACDGQTPCSACDGDQTCDDLLSSEQHCGGCGIACGTANGTPLCLDEGDGTYACVIGSCSAPFADCNGNYYDGCEANTASSASHCGGCNPTAVNPGGGTNCMAAVGTNHIAETSCVGSECQVISCDTDWADCNGDFDDGCEVNVTSTGDHCGGCTSGPTTEWDGGVVCDDQFENGVGECVAGACEFDSCSGSYGDCDGDIGLAALGNGCETNTDTSKVHCGGCSSPGGTPSGGVDCSSDEGSDGIATTSCTAGACEVATCTSGRGDCNPSFADGCETNTTTNISHCGGCDRPCTDKPHATATGCAGSACLYTCQSGWRDANTNWTDGCETAVISLVFPANRDAAPWASQNTGSGTPLTIAHTLSSAAGQNRLLLVGVACKGNGTDCPPSAVTFGTGMNTIALTRLGTSANTNASVVALYYALDAQLPAPGAYTLTLTTPANGYNALSAQILEFTGVDQGTFYAGHGANVNGNNCNNANPDLVRTYTALPTGSYVYAVVTGQSTSVYTNAQPPLDDLIGSQAPNGIAFGTALSETEVSGTQTPTYELANCNESKMYSVAIRPESPLY